MTTANSISQESIQQLDLILNIITSNARTVQTLSREILEHSGPSPEVAAMADALECVASCIGYMADEGFEKIGVPRNGPSHWFLPPALQNANAQKPAASVHHD